jgi:hypothetical protein
MRGMKWQGYKKRTSKTSNFLRKPDPLQLEVLAEDKVSRFDRTVVGEIFTTYWRIVAVGDVIVGYSPYPDASLILSVYSAGRVLSQIYEYVTEDKARLGPLPGSEMIPKNGTVMQDYWYLGCVEHCRALLWYALYSCNTAQPDLRALSSSWGWGINEFLGLIRVFDVTAIENDQKRFPLWPSLYWQHLRSNNVSLSPMAMSPEGIIERRLTGERITMTRFADTWTRHVTRGTGGGEITWVLGRRE